MHVLQLGPYPPPEGGIHRNMLAIRDELRLNGHQCSVIVTSKSSHITPEPHVYHPRTPFELIKLLSRIKFDILHIHVGGDISLRVLALLALCAFIGRGKSILTLHSGGYALEKAKTANRLSRDAFVFRRFQKIVGVNPLMMEVFGKLGIRQSRSHLIPPFVLRNPDESVEIPNVLATFADSHRPFLLSVCLLEDTYDLSMQIDAMVSILNEMPNAGLMIVGGGSLENDLKIAISEKPYADQILLAGNVEHKITLHLIKQADVLIRTTKFDGDAIAIREALFLGTPVIATDNGMRPEGVHLIPVGNLEMFAKTVKEVGRSDSQAKIARPPDNSNIIAVVELYREILQLSVL